METTPEEPGTSADVETQEQAAGSTQEMEATQEINLPATQPSQPSDAGTAGESPPKREAEEEVAPATQSFDPEKAVWNQVEGSSIVFPMARVKKIQKADTEVRTVNKDATILIAKTTELVIMKLAQESLQAAYRNKRKTINYSDVCSAVQSGEEFEFLEGTIKPGVGDSKLRAKSISNAQPVGEKRTLPDSTIDTAEEAGGAKQMKMDQMFQKPADENNVMEKENNAAAGGMSTE